MCALNMWPHKWVTFVANKKRRHVVVYRKTNRTWSCELRDAYYLVDIIKDMFTI